MPYECPRALKYEVTLKSTTTTTLDTTTDSVCLLRGRTPDPGPRHENMALMGHAHGTCDMARVRPPTFDRHSHHTPPRPTCTSDRLMPSCAHLHHVEQRRHMRDTNMLCRDQLREVAQPEGSRGGGDARARNTNHAGGPRTGTGPCGGVSAVSLGVAGIEGR